MPSFWTRQPPSSASKNRRFHQKPAVIGPLAAPVSRKQGSAVTCSASTSFPSAADDSGRGLWAGHCWARRTERIKGGNGGRRRRKSLINDLILLFLENLLLFVHLVSSWFGFLVRKMLCLPGWIFYIVGLISIFDTKAAIFTVKITIRRWFN